MDIYEFDPTLLHSLYFEDILINLKESMKETMSSNWMELFSKYKIADDLLFICTRFKIDSPDVRFNALWICLQYLEKKKERLKNKFPIMYVSVAISIKFYLSTVLSFNDIIRHLEQLDEEVWTKDNLLDLELDIMNSLDYKMRTPHLWSFVYAILSCFINPKSFSYENAKKFIIACQDSAEMIILRSNLFSDLSLIYIVAAIVSCGNMLYHKNHNKHYNHYKVSNIESHIQTRIKDTDINKLNQTEGYQLIDYHFEPLKVNQCIISLWISSIARISYRETIENGMKLFQCFNPSMKINNINELENN